MPENELTLAESRHEYDDIYSYFFTKTTSVAYPPGGYAHVHLYNLSPDIKAVREYSFASAPHEALIQFGIDHSSNSPYQQQFKSLKKGDKIAIFKLKSHMVWPPETPDVVMVAAGIGITPIRSFLMDRQHKNLPIMTHIIHTSREHFLYSDEISKLTDHYIQTHRDHFHTTLVNTATQYPMATYYVVGSLEFVESTSDNLRKYNIINIECDAFKGLVD
jgi:ferredoxin-NADP reductase